MSEPIISIRRRPRPFRKCLIVISLLLVLAIVGLYATGIGKQLVQDFGVIPPSESVEGDAWTHKDMIRYLRGRGLQFKAFPSNYGTKHGPAMWFARGESDASGEWYDAAMAGGGWGMWSTVHVQKLSSATTAKDEAGTLGDSGESWGRFIIVGDRELVADVYKVLKGGAARNPAVKPEKDEARDDDKPKSKAPPKAETKSDKEVIVKCAKCGQEMTVDWGSSSNAKCPNCGAWNKVNLKKKSP